LYTVALVRRKSRRSIRRYQTGEVKGGRGGWKEDRRKGKGKGRKGKRRRTENEREMK